MSFIVNLLYPSRNPLTVSAIYELVEFTEQIAPYLTCNIETHSQSRFANALQALTIGKP